MPKKGKYRRTKTGVRALTAEDNLYDLFSGGEQRDDERSDNDQSMEALLNETGVDSVIHEKEDGAVPSRFNALKTVLKQYPPPQAELDLHGCTAYEAREKVDQFIHNARAKSLQTLKIVVGKGLHSQFRAVLPDIVEQRIVFFKRRNMVMSFEWEKRRKRKSGALIVYMHRPAS